MGRKFQMTDGIKVSFVLGYRQHKPNAYDVRPLDEKLLESVNSEDFRLQTKIGIVTAVNAFSCEVVERKTNKLRVCGFMLYHKKGNIQKDIMVGTHVVMMVNEITDNVISFRMKAAKKKNERIAVTDSASEEKPTTVVTPSAPPSATAAATAFATAAATSEEKPTTAVTKTAAVQLSSSSYVADPHDITFSRAIFDVPKCVSDLPLSPSFEKHTQLEGESIYAEYKSLAQSEFIVSRIVQYLDKLIVAFLNTSCGGRAYFGVADNASVIGITLSQNMRDLLQRSVYDVQKKIMPPPPSNVVKITFHPVTEKGFVINDKFVCVVQVQGCAHRAAVYQNRHEVAYVREQTCVVVLAPIQIVERAIEFYKNQVRELQSLPNPDAKK